MSLNKSEMVLKWTEPRLYTLYKWKRDISSLFTFKKPHYEIFVVLTLIFILGTITFIVIYRVINDINVFVPKPPRLSTSMTNASLVTILFAGFGGFAACLILVFFLSLIRYLLERNITLYEDRIKAGKWTVKYHDISSFEINVSNCCSEKIPVLTLYQKEVLKYFDSPIDLGVSLVTDINLLKQILQKNIKLI